MELNSKGLIRKIDGKWNFEGSHSKDGYEVDFATTAIF